MDRRNFRGSAEARRTHPVEYFVTSSEKWKSASVYPPRLNLPFYTSSRAIISQNISYQNKAIIRALQHTTNSLPRQREATVSWMLGLLTKACSLHEVMSIGSKNNIWKQTWKYAASLLPSCPTQLALHTQTCSYASVKLTGEGTPETSQRLPSAQMKSGILL